MVPAPEATWDNQGEYTIVRVAQVHVQNAAGRSCLLRVTLRPADPAAQARVADFLAGRAAKVR